MKKSLMLVGMLTMVLSYAQEGRVGINTENPNATLEVAGRPNNANVVDGFIAPKIDGPELRAKTLAGLYGEAQKGAIVYVTGAVRIAANRTGALVNVDSEGYYYFDGKVWVKFRPETPTYTAGNGISIDENGQISATGENTNIYTNDGTLAGNRTVTMDGKTLGFKGGQTTFVGAKNEATVNVKGQGHTYVGFYKQDNNQRNAYLGYPNDNANYFELNNSSGDIRLTTPNNGTTELASKLKINNLPEDYNANNTLLVADQNGNVKKTKLYQAGEGIAIDPATNTISLAGGSGVSSNLYTADGTLAGNRTVTMDNKSLNFAGGKVGVNTANPSALLDITSPTIGGGFRLVDGSQERGKVLTSDANGNANWAWPTSPLEVFNVRGLQNLTIPAGSKDLHYTGIQLLLQPGRWISTISIGVGHSASTQFRIGGTFLRLRFLSEAQATSDVIKGAGSGGMVHPNAISSKFASLMIPFNTRQSVITGTLDVENNTNAPIRVYVYADIAATEGGNVDGNQTTLLFNWNESSLSTQEVR